MLAVVLFFAAPALAAQGTVAAQADLPIQVEGTHVVQGQDARFLLEGTAGGTAIVLHNVEGKAIRVLHRAYGFVNMQDPSADVRWDDRIERIELPLQDALLALDERQAGFQLLAYDGAVRMESGSQHGDLLVGAIDYSKFIDYDLETALSIHLNPPKDADRFSHRIPAGLFEARADDGRAAMDGPFNLFINNAVLTYVASDGSLEQILAHFRVETKSGGVYHPLSREWTGPGTHEEYIQEYLLIEATAGRMEVQFADQVGSLYASSQTIDVQGIAHLAGAKGTVTIQDGDESVVHLLTGEDLDLAGLFTLNLADSPTGRGTSEVTGSGDFTAVSYGAVAAKYDWTKAAVAAAGLGGLLLALAGWLVAQKGGLIGGASGLVAGYARVSGQEVLEHPGRQEVYERVKAFPGASFHQLADQVGFGASTLNYHLRVLERNGFITSVKDGRYLRFFDRQAGTYSGHKKVAVSALRNETTAAIAKHILRNPGVPQCDLAEEFEITASTVNWHINRLAGAGLVNRARDAHYTRYYVSEGWSQLPADEQQRYAIAVTA